MPEIYHNQLEIRGLRLHVAEIGNGPAVVFLHGFPEIWYSWKHQMLGLSKAGYRAICADFRGYGLSQHPPNPEEATFLDLVQDTIAILDALHVTKAFFVGKDFGAWPAYLLGLLFPERVLGVVSLGIPYTLPSRQPSRFDLCPEGFYILRWQNMLYPERVLGVVSLGIPYTLPSRQPSRFDLCPEGFYISRWQEPGRAEADFGRFDVKTVIKNIYILFSGSELPVANEDQEIMDLVDPSTPLPSWFSEEDLSVYAKLYENSGFSYALEMPYRCPKRKTKMPEMRDLKIHVPVLLIMGSKDYVLKIPGSREAIEGKAMEEHIPNLEITFLPEGTHFVQEQFPDQVNDLIINFIKNHIPSS